MFCYQVAEYSLSTKNSSIKAGSACHKKIKEKKFKVGKVIKFSIWSGKFFLVKVIELYFNNNCCRFLITNIDNFLLCRIELLSVVFCSVENQRIFVFLVVSNNGSESLMSVNS